MNEPTTNQVFKMLDKLGIDYECVNIDEGIITILIPVAITEEEEE